VEVRPTFQEILKAKGHAVVGGDFTAWNGNGRQYDRVLMNPPFEKGADMAHVRQAFNYVKGGGRLVAIMSNGFRFRQTNLATGFRAWLEEMAGDVVELPDDAFNGSNAFRRTGVKVVMVTVQKPGCQESDTAVHSTDRAASSRQSRPIRGERTLDAQGMPPVRGYARGDAPDMPGPASWFLGQHPGIDASFGSFHGQATWRSPSGPHLIEAGA